MSPRFAVSLSLLGLAAACEVVAPDASLPLEPASAVSSDAGDGVEAPLAADPTCPVSVPQLDGEWLTLPYVMPINPIAVELMRDGRVIVLAGSENDAYNVYGSGSMAYRAAVWDPTGTTQSAITAINLEYDFFCLASAQLPDGRALLAGGSRDYSFKGENRVSIWNPTTGSLNEVQSMADGRWYPTMVTLGDGRVFIWSGTKLAGGTNANVEIYDLSSAGNGWSAPIAPNGGVPTPPLFPRIHLLSNGKVFYTGQGSGTKSANSWLFTPGSNTWASSAAPLFNRDAGATVLLSLYGPAYANKVVAFGGAGRADTESIDLSAATPAWVAGPALTGGRIHNSASLLPNGKVVSHGGSPTNNTPNAHAKNADLYDPATNTIGSAGTSSYSRLYHSVSLLLPDATLAVFGSNPGGRGAYEPAIEIYKPTYLFTASGQPVTNRPTITGTSATKLGYGASFTATYTSGAPIQTAVLMRPGAATHALDAEQRLVELCGPRPGQTACAGSGGSIALTSPPNGNVAPPGWYMLFLLDSNGVPSKASWVQLSLHATTPPTGTIGSPAVDTTVTVGGSVSFGTSTVASGYSWSIPGGTPSKSSLQNPGAVVFNTAGTYVATLTAIDAVGNTDPNPPTRTITVVPATADFRIAVEPTSRRVLPGTPAQFTVTVTPLSGFTGSVILTVGSESGFPSGVTSGGFSPSTIVGGGTSTLTMNVAATAQPYALSLTLTGTSGALSRKTAATLIIGMDAPTNLSATPASGQVTLNWTASASVSRYIVKRSLTAGGPYTAIGCAASATTYLDSGLTNGTTYYYRVASQLTTGQNGGGQSFLSEEASATPTGGGAPAAPTGLVAESGDAHVDLSWSAAATATSYTVKRGTASGGPYTTLGTTASTTYSDNTATNGGTWYYVVSASNASGESPDSIEVVGTPQPPLPGAPTGLIATAGDGSASLQWNAVAGATSYTVKHATASGGPYTTVGTTAGTSFTDSPLTNGTTWYFVVSASNAAGEGPSSSEASAVPAGQPPAAPTGLVATGGTASIALSWTAVAGATSYSVKRSTTNGGPYTQLATSATAAYTDASATTKGVTYYYVVSAVNAAGEGANSAQAAAVLKPNAPTSLTRTVGSTIMLLNWVAGAGATSYDILRSTSSNGTYTVVGTATGTSFTASGLTNGTTYYFMVRSVNSAGVSGNSNKVNGKPGAMTLTFTAPNAGATVSGTNVSVKLSSTYGLGTRTYTLKLDGVVILTKSNTSNSVTFSWNSKLTTNGAHTLTATLSDSYGQSVTSAPRSVTVSN